MKILQIGTTDKSGGAALISWNIKDALEKLNHKVQMFVSIKYSNDPNVIVIKKILPKYYRYLCLLLSNDIDLFNTDLILKTKEFKESDIVHFHNLHGWFFNLKTLEKISNIKPSIWTLHDMWAITPHCAHSFDGELRDGFYQCSSLNSYPKITWHNEKYLMWRKKNIYKNSKIEIVVPSMWLKNKVENSILKHKNIHLIYNGVDTNIFKKRDRKEVRKDLNITQEKKIILFVSDGGKNNPYKGWEYVKKILENNFKNDSIHFICIGNTSNLEDEQNLKMTNVPKIDNPELLAKYYSAADIFLYPSLADSFGLVVAESMACGTPILTFDTGGIPEVVEHKKNGYVAKYKDLEDLENGLLFLINMNDNEQKKMAEESISKILNNFTKEIMVKNYINLYKSILKNTDN